MTKSGPPRGGGGEEGLFPRGPQTFRGLTLLPFWAACSRSFRFLLHCLHSISERLGSNAFTVRVSVDKFFDARVNMPNERR